MKCSELKSNDIIIFKKYCDILKHEDYQDGSIIAVYDEDQSVCICYLDGYQSKSDIVPYQKLVAKYDINGEHMKFGVFSGKSILLEV